MREVENLDMEDVYAEEYEEEYEDEYEEEYEDEEVNTETAVMRDNVSQADDAGDDDDEYEDACVNAWGGKENRKDDLREKLAAQHEEIDKLSAIINLQLSEIADGHKKNTQLYQDIARLESRICTCEEKQRALESENQMLCSKQKELEEDLANARELARTLLDEEKILQENIQLETDKREACENRLYQLEHSKSWKLTEPLRKVIGMINKN